MTDLTEQWRKGELPSGYYYVKNEFGNIFPSDYSENYDCISDTVIKDFFTEVSEIKEVLEPMPSYNEWKAKLEENAQLKELLKECRLSINGYPPYESGSEILRLTYRIDEALKCQE
jgi:hypothetical protein